VRQDAWPPSVAGKSLRESESFKVIFEQQPRAL
jgi:hypothetical protein